MKRALFIVIMLFCVGIAIGLNKSKSNGSYDVVFVDDLKLSDNQKIMLCVLNNQKSLELIEYSVFGEVEDIAFHILEIYDIYQNSIPVDYYTLAYTNYDIINFQIIRETVSVEIANFNGDAESFITALMWTYKYLGFSELEIVLNGKRSIVNENRFINLQDESNHTITTISQNIYFRRNTNILPVTYLHNKNKIDFIMEKLFTSDIDYSYITSSGNLYLYIIDNDFRLTKDDLILLEYNLKELKEFNEYVIIKNGCVF